jgi:hypothetical protein
MVFGIIVKWRERAINPGAGMEMPCSQKSFTRFGKEAVMIDNKEMLKQVIQFNKTTFFDNALKAMKMSQEQGEKMLKTMLDQATWMPAEGKKAVNDWLKAYKKGIDDFKSVMDEQYEKLEDFLSK